MKRYSVLNLILLAGLLMMAACSNEEAGVEEAEERETGVTVTDEELFSVLEANVAFLMEKDEAGYMGTIHSVSPSYEVTGESVEDLFTYDLMIELEDLEVIEKSAQEARVAYVQHTAAINDQDYDDHQTIGEHLLRPENGEWKIYQSEVAETIVLEREEPGAEEVEMDGEFADSFLRLNHPFDSGKWVLADYSEQEGEARAEYIHPEENLGNYSQIAALEYYENGSELSNLAHFISVLEWSLLEHVTGELDFNRLYETESEVLYAFSVTEDAEQEEQHEMGRVFIVDNDIYLARYTVFGEEPPGEDIYEMLREIY